MSRWDAIVVGAGYIGCSISYHLTQAGLKTLLIDQGGIGAGASSANYGNIQVQDAELAFSLPMVLAGKAYYETLPAELDADLELRQCGSLLIAEQERHIPMLQTRAALLHQAGIGAQWLERDELRLVEPNLDAEQSYGALYNADEMQLNPFKLMWAFVSRARERGCVLQLHSPVRGFILENGRLLGVYTDEGPQLGAITILATGAWSRQLGKQLGIDIPVKHVHGQAAVTSHVGSFLRNTLSSAAFFEDTHAQDEANQEAASAAALAIAPNGHGNLLLGEASEVVEHFGKGSDVHGIRAVCSLALRFLPGLRHVDILRSWAAPVAFTDDGRPYLGPVPGVEGLLLAVAFKSTVVIAPLIGRTISQLVTDGQSDLVITPFLLSRTTDP